MLETERLILRRWRDSDRAPFARLNADPVVMEHFVKPLDRSESDAFADRIEARLEADGYGLWALEVRDVAPFVGFVGLAMGDFDAPFMPALEIGWRLGQDAWGCGYATEAARAVLVYAFTELHRDEIDSWTAVGNIRSQAVMQRIGMRRDPAGDFEHPRVPPGHPVRHHVLYRLTREQWSTVGAEAR